MNFIKRNWFWLALISIGGFLFLAYWTAQKAVAAAETGAEEVAGTVAGGTLGAAMLAMPGIAPVVDIFESLF